MTETAPKSTPKDEITSFLASKEAGMVSAFSAQTLTKAAESMFTGKGLQCPIKVITTNGAVVVINREIYLAAQAP